MLGVLNPHKILNHQDHPCWLSAIVYLVSFFFGICGRHLCFVQPEDGSERGNKRSDLTGNIYFYIIIIEYQDGMNLALIL
jgi:hypothetical protein